MYAPKRTKFGKRMRGLVEIAKKYEDERLAVIERSGLNDHLERVRLAALALQELAREVAEIEPLTMAGAAIQARALCAYAAAEDGYDKCWSKLILGLPLAQSIARLTRDINSEKAGRCSLIVGRGKGLAGQRNPAGYGHGPWSVRLTG
jgi:hypothetical protein